jgi:hypothetical protein
MPNLKPNKLRIYSKRFKDGANTSVGKERLGSSEKEFYYDLLNGRPQSYNGAFGDISKIKGEDNTVFPEYIEDVSSSYACIGMTNCNDHVICIYASNVYPTSIVIDGILVLQSDNLGFLPQYHLDIAVNENCVGGEIYLTDNHIPPVYFNVDSLIDNVDTELYFSEFVLEIYTIGTEGSVNHPIFKELVDVGVGGGLPAGQVMYAINFVDSAGNSSPLSYPTPMIFIPSYYNEVANNTQIPFNKVRGKEENPDEFTSYGVKIKFRIDNVFNYEYYQIIKVSFIAGEAIGFTPPAYIIKKVAITPGQFTIEEFIDSRDSEDTPIPITITEEVAGYGNITKAKCVRYFNRRVVLANVEYADVSSDNEVEYVSGSNKMFPIIEDIGVEGYDNCHNHTYKKSLLNGEKYGWSSLFIDGFSGKFYAVPITGFEDFQMPNNREEMTLAESIDNSSPVTTSLVDGTIGLSFERVDVTNCVDRSKLASVSIVNGATVYNPLEPVNVTDLNSDFDERVVNSVLPDGVTPITYNPDCYKPEFKALGVGFKGYESIPSWAQAFAILRTERAGRVVCQGLGMYALTQGDRESALSSSNASISKAKNKIWFHSPDIDNGIINLDDLLANPSGYKAQFVSPTGFCSEIYSFNEDNWSPFGDDQDHAIDMLCNPVVFKEKTGKRMNDGDLVSDIGVYDGVNTGHVAYGKWRNNLLPTVFAGSAGGNTEFVITNITEKVEYGGLSYIEITFNQEIYNYDDSGTNRAFDDNDQKNFQEPFYIVNIIKTASVPDANIQEYYMTEHYQKMKAKIGVSSGDDIQSFEIVDERVEDFFVEAGDGDTNKFIFIKEVGTVNLKRWINTTEKSGGDVITIDLDIANGTTVYCGERLYGKYKATEDIIYFDETTNSPVNGSFIYILYDKTAIIKVFGGDSVIGGVNFCPINKKSGSDAQTDDQFCFNAAFPYYEWVLAPGIDIVKNADPLIGDPTIQSNRNCKIGLVRQLLMYYYCQSVSHTPLDYRAVYPLVHYVYRPNKWDKDKTMAENGMDAGYISDYPDEILNWERGGFKTGVTRINIDYSKQPYNFKYSSKPIVGFVDQLRFCNRIVWSLQKILNETNSPNLKTFLINNTYDISDNKGDITKLYDDIGGKGMNLYAICYEDINLLYTEKTMLSSLSGEELAVISENGDINFIKQDEWLKLSGCPDMLYRFMAESPNALFFPNYTSFYRFSGGELKDIGFITPYYKTLKEDFFDRLKEVYKGIVRAAVYDTNFKEYIVHLFTLRVTSEDFTNLPDQANNFTYPLQPTCVTASFESCYMNIFSVPVFGEFTLYVYNGNEFGFIGVNVNLSPETYTLLFGQVVMITVLDGVVTYSDVSYEDFVKSGQSCGDSTPNSKTLVYSEIIENWVGKNELEFTKGTSFDSLTYIERDSQTIKINSGFQIQESAYTTSLKICIAPEDAFVKMFVRFKIDCNKKPTLINFYDETFSTVIATLDPSALRNYGEGYEQYIPRKIASPNDRIKGKFLNMEVQFNGEEDFYISSIELKYRRIY